MCACVHVCVCECASFAACRSRLPYTTVHAAIFNFLDTLGSTAYTCSVCTSIHIHICTQAQASTHTHSLTHSLTNTHPYTHTQAPLLQCTALTCLLSGLGTSRKRRCLILKAPALLRLCRILSRYRGQKRLRFRG